MFMRRTAIRSRLVATAAILGLSASAALGLEEPKGEQEALKACERRLCHLVTTRKPAIGDFTCRLSKTWAKATLKEGSSTGNVSWGFGDARCTVDIKLARATIVSALSDHKATLEFPDHAVSCIIEREDGPTNVTAVLAPKAKLEGGRVKKVWVNLKKVEGPGIIKSLAITVAKLEDKIGIFHRPLVKSINKLLHEKCPKVVAEK
jgi:hypothetical protein